MSSSFTVSPSRRVSGRMQVPGDKSISHRALMLGAIAQGTTRVSGFLPGEDCLATLAAIRAMGVQVEQHDATTITVHGKGLHGLTAAPAALDMGNSGTAMRLFMGLLAAQGFNSELIGDESLSRRPMERVAVPLRLMGADIRTTAGKPPVHVLGRRKLQGIRYALPVASAQLKSALLLAGLYADGDTELTEPAVTRDHTERMLISLGQPVACNEQTVCLRGGGQLTGTDIRVPGDLSSAAFFVLAACLAAEGELVIDNVGLNPTRTGILRILALMGADLRVEPAAGSNAEPVGPTDHPALGAARCKHSAGTGAAGHR
jgi:3-phosphoshikimate 1-carboxyvinyltransferase